MSAIDPFLSQKADCRNTVVIQVRNSTPYAVPMQHVQGTRGTGHSQSLSLDLQQV